MNKYQTGGIKIIADSKVVNQFDHKTLFIEILKKTVSVETLSVASLTGLLLRLNIPEDRTPFRSDVVDEQNRPLHSDTYMLPNTGIKITQLVLKCCIIQELDSKLLELDNFHSKYRKKPAKLSEMVREFKTQRLAYEQTLKLGGSPVCPDAIAFIRLSSAEFQGLFFADNDEIPEIYAKNPVFQYIRDQLADYPNIRAVSLTLMESIAPTYEPLSAFVSTIKKRPVEEQHDQLPVFQDIALRVLAITVVMFYFVGILPLDGHLGNWMLLRQGAWSSLLPIEQSIMSPFRIRAIDFGQCFFRNKNLAEINHTMKQYFQRFTDTRSRRLQQFAQLLGFQDNFIQSEEEAGDAFAQVLQQLNRAIDADPRGSILWDGNAVIHADLNIDESMQLIHKILFLAMVIDSCHNTVRMNTADHRFQMRAIFDTVYGGDCHTPVDMMNEQLGYDLHAYMANLVDEDQAELHYCLTKIKKYVGDYLHWKDDFITHIYFDWSGTLAKPKTREIFAFGKTREEQLSVLYDDTLEVLDYLTKKGYTLGIITNTGIGQDNFMTALHKTGLIEYFEGTIVVGDDEQICRKGCSEIFEYVLGNDDIRATNALMVGDDYVRDIVSSHKLRMNTAFIDQTNEAETGVANLKVSNLRELTEYLSKKIIK